MNKTKATRNLISASKKFANLVPFEDVVCGDGKILDAWNDLWNAICEAEEQVKEYQERHHKTKKDDIMENND